MGDASGSLSVISWVHLYQFISICIRGTQLMLGRTQTQKGCEPLLCTIYFVVRPDRTALLKICHLTKSVLHNLSSHIGVIGVLI
jgi:hypothetical protein